MDNRCGLERRLNITAPISNCPFCGAEAKLDWNLWNGVRVVCTHRFCGIATDWMSIYEDIEIESNKSVWDELSLPTINDTTAKLSALKCIMKWNRRV